MDKLVQACVLSNEEWVNALPNDIPDYSFSQAHNQKMQKLINKMHGDKYHSTSKKAFRIILAAAVILSLSISTTVFAFPESKPYIFENNGIESSYEVSDISICLQVRNLHVGYLPDGVQLAEKTEDSVLYSNYYKSDSKDILIQKQTLDGYVIIDTEYSGTETIHNKGIDYLIYYSENGFYGAVWNNGRYLYTVDGKLSRDELLNIIKSVY